jgi:hypothetical protein
VLDAAPLTADLLSSISSMRILTTSRAPLHVRGEREYAVGPLSLEVDFKAASPASLSRSPAVRLFMERVRDVQPDFRLTSANGPTVAAICQRLDALPLAIELAAPDQGADGRRPAPPARACCPARDDRSARSSRTTADDQCHGRVELPPACPAEQHVFRARYCRTDFRSKPPRRLAGPDVSSATSDDALRAVAA